MLNLVDAFAVGLIPAAAIDHSVALLADAFAADPVVAFLFEGCLDEAARRRAFFEYFAGDAADRHTLDVAGGAAAIWHEYPTRTEVKSQRALEEWVFAGREERAAATGGAMRSSHPSQAHWYLYFIGSDVQRPGQGLGSELLRCGLDRADAAQLPCYLEATSQLSAALYERWGFVRREPIQIPGGPELYPMWREGAL